MLVCDICGKEIRISRDVVGFNSKQNIHYMFSASRWQTKEVDMCCDCQRELKDKLDGTESEWYNNKMNNRGEK